MTALRDEMDDKSLTLGVGYVIIDALCGKFPAVKAVKRADNVCRIFTIYHAYF